MGLFGFDNHGILKEVKSEKKKDRPIYKKNLIKSKRKPFALVCKWLSFFLIF
jgi:hypothetical protein